jgi:hypothetical protein
MVSISGCFVRLKLKFACDNAGLLGMFVYVEHGLIQCAELHLHHRVVLNYLPQALDAT